MQKLVDSDPQSTYMTKNYEVECFTKDNIHGFLSNNFIIRVSNSLTTAMNAARVALPTEIIIVLDNQYLKEEYFGDREMPRLISQLLSNISETIRIRKKQLQNQYWQENSPRIMFIRPLPRPAFSLSDVEKYKYIRRKFSTELEEVTSQHRVQLVNIDDLNASQRVLFDSFGNLSEYGIEQFWKSLSEYLKRSDKDEYYAVRRYRVPKRTVSTQTWVQQETNNQPQKQAVESAIKDNSTPYHNPAQQFLQPNPWPNQGNPQIHHRGENQYPVPQANYNYQYTPNDRFHYHKK